MCDWPVVVRLHLILCAFSMNAIDSNSLFLFRWVFFSALGFFSHLDLSAALGSVGHLVRNFHAGLPISIVDDCFLFYRDQCFRAKTAVDHGDFFEPKITGFTNKNLSLIFFFAIKILIIIWIIHESDWNLVCIVFENTNTCFRYLN